MLESWGLFTLDLLIVASVTKEKIEELHPVAEVVESLS